MKLKHVKPGMSIFRGAEIVIVSAVDKSRKPFPVEGVNTQGISCRLTLGELEYYEPVKVYQPEQDKTHKLIANAAPGDLIWREQGDSVLVVRVEQNWMAAEYPLGGQIMTGLGRGLKIQLHKNGLDTWQRVKRKDAPLVAALLELIK